ncbi:hypothetical protein E1091_15765 [Micromonospora fluostatini]|uniref:Uncharacterized protein n=1 Tax=Micromonospora fluostatini TaxID=1629071 RepID=A0ABY2DEJ5_9ACTN|nr:hypothetical protein E1091_15765 [Micromonospora fluostatini]
MSVTRTFVTTVTSVLATAAFAAILGIGAAVGGSGADSSLATEVCPKDTHWSAELGVCVADTHW